MDKIKLEYKRPRRKTIKYKDYEISLLPFLGYAEQIFLINHYVNDYFEISENNHIDNTEYDLLGAEFKLKNYMLQMLTNIDTDSLDNDIYADPVFWGVIADNIGNYAEFKRTLSRIVGEIKDQLVLKNSIGKVISDLVEKLYALLDKFSDMQPEELEKMQKQGLELLERLEKSSVLGTSKED